MLDLFQLGSPRIADLISPELNKKLMALGEARRYTDGEIIHRRGDTKVGLTIVKAGAMRVGVQGVDGSFVTTTIFGEGQCIGEFTLFLGLPRTHDVSAMGDCLLQQIPEKPFMALFNQEPELARGLLSLSLLRTHAMIEMADDFRRLPKEVHLAKVLLGMSQSAVNPSEIHCLQEDLAFMLGVSRVSLGKLLHKLQHAGLVTLGYRKIQLPDLPKLENWIEERALVSPVSQQTKPSQ